MRTLYIAILIFWLFWLAIVLKKYATFEWLQERFDHMKEKKTAWKNKNHGSKTK